MHNTTYVHNFKSQEFTTRVLIQIWIWKQRNQQEFRVEIKVSNRSCLLSDAVDSLGPRNISPSCAKHCNMGVCETQDVVIRFSEENTVTWDWSSDFTMWGIKVPS